MTTILVTGGRDYNDRERVFAVLDEIAGTVFDSASIKIVNGGCSGADQLSTQWTKERGFKFVEVPVAANPDDAVKRGARYNWVTDGKAAGPLRNQFMIDEHRPDRAVAFPGGRGTEDCLCRLFRAGVETRVVGR